MIRFNIPPFLGEETKFIAEAIENRKLSGDGEFSKRCHHTLEEMTGAKKALLTTSATDALEMAAILSDIKPGDEVIMPSYTFVSTANAFVLRGAQVVFVDIRPDTMNIDETKIEAAITPKTKVIVPIHYAGVACEMDTINALAKEHRLKVVEDAAQGVFSFYKGKALGTLGDFGCFSFHETKNYSCGEGGAILINNDDDVERAEIIREKGTNRSKFFRGEIDKYTWVDIGSSFLPSELNAAYLYAQIKDPNVINDDRHKSWNHYYKALSSLAEQGKIELPQIPSNCVHNAHMFYIKAKDLKERTELSQFLKDHGVGNAFHYIPLHSSNIFSRFSGQDIYTTKESERLLRLPMYYGLTENDIDYVVSVIEKFYH